MEAREKLLDGSGYFAQATRSASGAEPDWACARQDTAYMLLIQVEARIQQVSLSQIVGTLA